MADPTTIIATHIQNDLLKGSPITNDENLLLTGRLDSLAVMQLVSFLEDRFSLEIPFEEVLIENFETIDAIASYISSKHAKA